LPFERIGTSNSSSSTCSTQRSPSLLPRTHPATPPGRALQGCTRCLPPPERETRFPHLVRRQVDQSITALASTLTPQVGSHQPPRPSSVGRSSSHEPHHGQRAARPLRWLATACSGRWGGARPESVPNLTVKSYASRSCGSRSGDFDRSWARWTTSKRSWTHPTCWTAVPGAFEWSVG
jgi:hypothetical protein